MADVDATLKITATSKKAGLSLGDLRRLVESAEGKDDNTKVRVISLGWRSQIRGLRVE